jgi:hypothetical protein
MPLSVNGPSMVRVSLLDTEPAMILALLIGCLTPEMFTREYLDATCEGLIACDDAGADEICDSLDATEIPVMTCAEWDAGAAQSCVDSMRDSCGHVTPECKGQTFCEGRAYEE